MKRPSHSLAAAAATALCLALGCSAPGGPGAITNPWFYPDAGRDGAAAADAPRPSAAAGRCVPVKAEPLPARVNAMATGPSASPPAGREVTMFASDLFGLFRSHCGACHAGAAALGSFNVNPSSFAQKLDQKVLDLIRSDDPAKVMPPPANGGKPFSQRGPGDPVVELVSLLERWVEQGKKDEFVIGREGGGGGGGAAEATYLLSAEIGQRLTNLGDCVPEREVVGSSTSDMDELDTRFAALTALPDTLNETDLTTLDGESLARRGVVAFAPAYPLWADNAAKIRHIRVPRGQSVRFDKDKQRFSIPPNTRFYKTFLKKVVDRDGNTSYRKMETRLIVSRQDIEKPDGTAEVTALFGTYVWNEDETEAHLLKDPLRNGQPFRDRVLSYATDEPKLEEVRATKPRNLTFTLETKHPGLIRRYAIPSAQRCLDCHMGSDSASFILGFTPLQIARRPDGQGGVLEATAEDELNQLQRMIDYGVISGMTSPADVLPLEKSQGERQPRNDHELTAQGYMLGACANCHNPRGLPSVKSPELKSILDMMPSASGGIFQFPLERFSPIRRRGIGQDVPMPYISPSLREYPVDSQATENWTPKWADCAADPKLVWKDCITRGSARFRHIEAPWRSLLYRNVDTPYTYIDDFVMFPRMPMHGPGFDCRLRRLMGDWMVSIPAVRKNAEAAEDTVPGSEFAVDREPQPYREVKPGEAGYQEAKEAARKRLETYHTGGRYADELCPDTTDIVDPAIKGNPGDPLVPEADAVYGGENKQTMVVPNTRVPLRPHWVVTDLTEPGGDWNPRRANWSDFLVKGMLPADPAWGTAADEENIRRQRAAVKDALGTAKITDELRRLATTPQPYGLWESKPACADELSKIPTAGSIPEAQRPRWMQQTKPAAEAHLYMQSAGQAVYNTICFNCHGPAADSKGLMAEAIMLMTGGEARVANFRDGLFGPVTAPGTNRNRVFGAAPVSGATGEDLAARYMAWMALGGTEQRLPQAVLNIVATTRVLGKARASNRIDIKGSPNMLELARELCGHTLLAFRSDPVELDLSLNSGSIIDWSTKSGLIDGNMDAEMWQRLCAQENRPVVRVPMVSWASERPRVEISGTESLYFGDVYPADADVMDHRGQVHKGITRDNLFPLCIRKPSAPSELAAADKWLAEHPVGSPGSPRIPYCPDKLFELGTPLPDDPPGTTRQKWKLLTRTDESGVSLLVDAERWSLQGAVNAGIAVFLYLDELERGKVKPLPPYNKCEELGKP